jgi:hypothetical protein
MKRFKFSLWHLVHWRTLLGLVGVVAICWFVGFLMQERQARQERALYGGRTIHEWIGLAMKDLYWSAHWVTLNPPEYANSEAEQRVIAMGAPAVPELIKQLRSLHPGSFRQKLVFWRLDYLPHWKSYPEYLEIPGDVSCEAALINYLLSQMGEAARPAVPSMLDSMVDLHAWAYYDLLDDLVRMGPVAREAVPTLKNWAHEGDKDAARALKYLERGNTELELDDEGDGDGNPSPDTDSKEMKI